MRWGQFALLVMATRKRQADRPEVAAVQALVDRAAWSPDGGRWVVGPAGAKMGTERKGARMMRMRWLREDNVWLNLAIGAAILLAAAWGLGGGVR